MGSDVEDTCPTEDGTRTEKTDEEISKLKQEVQEIRKELEKQIA